MIIITTISEKYFTLNGVQYAKIYQPLKQGVSAIGIYNTKDTRQKLISSTVFGDYEIDGATYSTQEETIAALLPVIYLEDATFDNRVYNYTGDQIVNNITNNPDNEDIEENSNVLRFKNRDSNVNGRQGYKIIRSTEDLTALPASYSDSILEIRYSFDLGSGTMSVPSGSSLLFKGGIIKNGGVVFNGGQIINDNGDSQIFDNVSILGNVNQKSIIAEWFGVIGDDNTDNTTVIQKILSSVSNIEIEFNKGVYLTGNLVNSNKVTISGRGTIKAIDEISNHIFLPNNEIVFKDITLDGNKLGQSVNSYDLITSTYKIEMYNCKGINSKRYGFRTVGGHNSKVINCYFSNNNNDCIYFADVQNGIIKGNFTENTNLGHQVELLNDCQNCIVEGNILNSNAASKFCVEIWSDTTNGINNNVNSNIINGNNTGGGISLSASLKGIVANNNIKNCISVASIELAQGASNNLITGNFIENSYRIAITGTSSKEVNKNKVIGNKFLYPIKNDVNGGQGIYVNYANNNEIYQNIIDTPQVHAVQIENSDGNIFKGNKFSDGLLSVFYISNSIRNIFQGNYAENFMTGGRSFFQLVGTNTDTTIVDNQGLNLSGLISDFTDVSERSNHWDIDNPISGSLSLSAGTTTTINNKNITANSRIILVPKNSAASAITGLYVSARVTKSSFTLTHSSAAGSGAELFDFVIL